MTSSVSTSKRYCLVAAALLLAGVTATEAQSSTRRTQFAGDFSQPKQVERLPPPDDGGGGGGNGGGTPQARNGMTWAKIDHSTPYGSDHVDCSLCNAYSGDTSCSTSLPVLCVKVEGSPNPGLPTSFYYGWAGGNIALTLPIQGSSLGSLANANALCQLYHGSGWRMAEHHDGGGGWGFWAYGNVSNASRFWTYINNQPANCWN